MSPAKKPSSSRPPHIGSYRDSKEGASQRSHGGRQWRRKKSRPGAAFKSWQRTGRYGRITLLCYMAPSIVGISE